MRQNKKQNRKRRFNRRLEDSIEHQEVVIINSAFFRVIEIISYTLHILAFILGGFTLIGIAIINSWGEHILEFITLIVVFIIIMIPVLKNFIIQRFIRKSFNEIWGKNKLKFVVKLPKNIQFIENDMDLMALHGEVTSFLEFNDDIWLTIDWDTKSWKPKRKLEIKFEMRPGVMLKLNINYIMIDVLNRTIKINSLPPIVENKAISEAQAKMLTEQDFTLQVTTKEKKITWSGTFPNYPFYGEWEW